ncbi:putative MFS transporter [Mycena venus]|uniref:Putative MFS transporter n=1 Tax=Mycena venus TaxID=2733690 RepID=A0A8H6YMH6_9AGAR|nr:putative MFS transporter [Mycena venus]
MSTAKASVISTPELLEITLTHLPMRDLLVTAPLVSKTWHAATLTPALQRALFFQPAPLSAPVLNPLLAEIFPPFFTPGIKDSCIWPGTADSIMSMPWSKAPDAFKRPEASWRRMLVTQPPARTLILAETTYGQSGVYTRRTVVDDLSLRMGALYDFAVPFIDCPDASFCIRFRNGDDADAEHEGGLILSVTGTESWAPERGALLDERFYYSDHDDETDSELKAAVEINYGDWVLHSDVDGEEWVQRRGQTEWVRKR